MNFIVNKKQKKIYVFEIFLLILILILITTNAYLFLYPKLTQAENRDTERQTDALAILDGLEVYLSEDEGALEFLEDIELCVNGFTEIGTGDNRFDLISVLSSYSNEEINDPTNGSDEQYTGYDICRSYDSYRYVVRASKSEINQIQETKRIMLQEEPNIENEE